MAVTGRVIKYSSNRWPKGNNDSFFNSCVYMIICSTKQDQVLNKLEIHYFSFYIYFLGHFCLVGYHGIFLIYKMFHCSKKVRKHCFDAQKITTAPVITTLRQVSPAQPTTTGMPGAQAAAPGQNPIRWSLIPKNTFFDLCHQKNNFSVEHRQTNLF